MTVAEQWARAASAEDMNNSQITAMLNGLVEYPSDGTVNIGDIVMLKDDGNVAKSAINNDSAGGEFGTKLVINNGNYAGLHCPIAKLDNNRTLVVYNSSDKASELPITAAILTTDLATGIVTMSGAINIEAITRMRISRWNSAIVALSETKVVFVCQVLSNEKYNLRAYELDIFGATITKSSHKDIASYTTMTNIVSCDKMSDSKVVVVFGTSPDLKVAIVDLASGINASAIKTIASGDPISGHVGAIDGNRALIVYGVTIGSTCATYACIIKVAGNDIFCTSGTLLFNKNHRLYCLRKISSTKFILSSSGASNNFEGYVSLLGIRGDTVTLDAFFRHSEDNVQDTDMLVLTDNTVLIAGYCQTLDKTMTSILAYLGVAGSKVSVLKQEHPVGLGYLDYPIMTKLNSDMVLMTYQDRNDSAGTKQVASSYKMDKGAIIRAGNIGVCTALKGNSALIATKGTVAVNVASEIGGYIQDNVRNILGVYVSPNKVELVPNYLRNIIPQ